MEIDLPTSQLLGDYSYISGGKKWWVCTGRIAKPINHAGQKEWRADGKLHRDGDLPAVERDNGDKEWWKNGVLHRDGDKPALEFSDGGKQWCKNDELHRDNDLPAVIRANGEKEWWKNGQRYYPDAI